MVMQWQAQDIHLAMHNMLHIQHTTTPLADGQAAQHVRQSSDVTVHKDTASSTNSRGPCNMRGAPNDQHAHPGLR